VAHTDQEGAPWPHRVGDLGPFALLDVAATRDEAATAMAVTVVNRSLEEVAAGLEGGPAAAAAGATGHPGHGPGPGAAHPLDEPVRRPGRRVGAHQPGAVRARTDRAAPPGPLVQRPGGPAHAMARLRIPPARAATAPGRPPNRELPERGRRPYDLVFYALGT